MITFQNSTAEGLSDGGANDKSSEVNTKANFKKLSTFCRKVGNTTIF